MSFLSGIGDLLKQYSEGNAGQKSDGGSGAPAVEQHFDQVAPAVPSSSLAGGLAEAFRSGETAPFPQMAAELFAHGNSQQQAGMLNSLMAAVGPAVLSQFAGSVPNSPLAALLRSGSVTPAETANVSPADVQALTEHAQKQDPSIIDRVSEIYAEHPTLIKTLGATALTIAMKKIAEQHAA
jgi:hypothetical protein